MEAKIKQFGPLVIEDQADDVVEEIRASVDLAYGYCSIDEMIKALREAANWLEWRKASEGTNG